MNYLLVPFYLWAESSNLAANMQDPDKKLVFTYGWNDGSLNLPLKNATSTWGGSLFRIIKHIDARVRLQ